MDSDRTNTDNLLKQMGGCGRFQIMMASMAYLPQIAFAFTMLFMSFGAFNPGWRCRDINGTTANSTVVGGDVDKIVSLGGVGDIIGSDSDVNAGGDSVGGGGGGGGYTTEMKCSQFKACHGVEFNPEASTIITEWALVCDQEWVPFMMMSMQMVGVLTGTLMSGILGDRIGRKKTLYTFVLFNIVLNCISIFSKYWKTYMALRFLLGITCGVIGYTPCMFITEFVPPKWRVRISSLPLWSIGAMLFGIVTMSTRDWRHIHIVSTVISSVCLLPVLWVPESLRWLMVNGKKIAASEVVQKISYWNKKQIPSESSIDIQIENSRHSSENSNSRTIFSLFKRKTIIFTLTFGVLFLSIDLIYYATSFGISSLPGNIYTNFFILFATEIPSNLISSTVPNVLGRRPVCIASYSVQAVCLLSVGVVGIYTSGQTKVAGTLSLIVIARLRLAVEWYVILAYVSEVYPTVVRSTASGYGGLMASLGSITAPYLIPSDASKQYISYFIMAGFTFICCLLLPLLPETKNTPLRDTWTGNGQKQSEVKGVNMAHALDSNNTESPLVMES